MNEMRKLMESVKPLFEGNLALNVAKAVDQMGIAIGNDEKTEIIPAIHQALQSMYPGEKNMIRGYMNDPDFIPDVMGYMRHGVEETGAGAMASVVEDERDDEREALQELMDMQEQLGALSDRANDIMSTYFPNEYRQAQAYGALDFGVSSNPHDTTFDTILQDIEKDFF